MEEKPGSKHEYYLGKKGDGLHFEKRGDAESGSGRYERAFLLRRRYKEALLKATSLVEGESIKRN